MRKAKSFPGEFSLWSEFFTRGGLFAVVVVVVEVAPQDVEERAADSAPA